MGSTAVGAVVEGLAGSESGYLLPEMQLGEAVRPVAKSSSVYVPLAEELRAKDASGPAVAAAEAVQSSFLLPGLGQEAGAPTTGSVYALDRLDSTGGDLKDQGRPLGTSGGDESSGGSVFQLAELKGAGGAAAKAAVLPSQTSQFVLPYAAPEILSSFLLPNLANA